MPDATRSHLPVHIAIEDGPHLALGAQAQKGTVDLVVHDGDAQCIVVRMLPFEADALILSLQIELNQLTRKVRVI